MSVRRPNRPTPPGPTAEIPVALVQALAQSHDVHRKVEACADDLAVSNDGVKAQLAAGATTLSAAAALAEGEAVESAVQECAEDLDHVTATLADGIDELREIERALAHSRQALAATSASLREVRAEASAATHRALHDPTTGLPNRELFDDRLAQAIAMADRRGWTLAVMFLDLDRFKGINDTHGHDAGDVVLKEVARRIGAHARDADTVCRLGGDEFLYLLVDPCGAANVRRIAESVIRAIELPIDIGDRQLSVRPSIGIAMYPADATTSPLLIKRADAAMYDAKRSGVRPAGAALTPGAGAHRGAGARTPRVFLTAVRLRYTEHVFMSTPKLASIPPDVPVPARPVAPAVLESPPSDAIPPPLREVIALFAGPLAAIAFPDVDAALLGRQADELRAAARELDRARAAVDDAQRQVGERTATLAAAARRGLAYARIYADAHPDLGLGAALAGLDTTPAAGAPIAPRRGRPRKHPRPELPFAAGGDAPP